jgi:PPIC-type PPIASE domain
VNWRSALREPLFYFIVAGGLVFGADAALRRDSDTIRVTPAVRAEVTRSLQARLGRPPDAGEIQSGIEGWRQEQALYREGVKMGLLGDDPVVRAHIASKLLNVAREREVLPEPTDAELRDFFERHRSAFTTPPTYDFDVVFVAKTDADARAGARADADRVLAELRGGASPEGLGDWLPRGHRYTRESPADVASLFGEQAAKEMPRYAAGEWNVVAGPRGLYALRVIAADRGEPDFATLRPALALAFDAERRDSAALAYARQVEGHYRFVTSE